MKEIVIRSSKIVKERDYNKVVSTVEPLLPFSPQKGAFALNNPLLVLLIIFLSHQVSLYKKLRFCTNSLSTSRFSRWEAA